MTRIRAALLCLVGLAALPLPALQAQNPVGPPPAGDASGTAVVAPTQDVLGTASYTGSAPVGPFGGYLFFRKDIGQGVGYDEGLTTLGWFQPIQTSEHGIAFAQGQFFVSDDGDFGGNLGGGYRHYFPSIDRLFGGWAFYDSDESTLGHNYDQFGVGVETLGRRWDARANLYAPLSSKTHFQGVAGPFGATPSFVQHNLLFNGSAYFEKAMPGADVEFGLPILDPSALGRLRAYFGAYVYDSVEKNPAGVRARLETHLNQYFTIGAAFLHDDIHGGQATLAVDIRAWSKDLPPISNYRPTQEPKLYLPVVRQYRIAADRFIDEFTAVALGNDGQPLDFVWVDNSNPNAGDGTFEDPFHDMPASAPGADFIFVRLGDSTPGNPVVGGIVLEDGQTMYGEGFRFAVPVAGTKFGIQPLAADLNIDTLVPGWDRNGNYPFISNPAGDVITLASNNSVGGFNIISSAGHGIAGNNINNFELFRLNIGNANPGLGNGGNAIFLTNASGVGTIDDFTFLNNGGGGLVVNNTSTAPLTLSVTGRLIGGPNVVGGTNGLSLVANASTINATIQSYLNDSSGNGANLFALNGGLLNVGLQDSTFNNSTIGDGMHVLASNSSTLMLDVQETTAVNAAQNGLNVEVFSGSLFTGSFNSANLGGNSFSGAGNHGVRLASDSSPNVFNLLTFNNTTINNSTNDGLHIELSNGSFFGVQFHNGQINNSGGNAIFDSQTGGSTLNLDVDPTSLADSGLNAFLFNISGGSILNANFLDVDMSRSGANGILGTLNSGSTATLNLTDSLIEQSGQHGVFLTALGGSTFNGNFDTVSLQDSNQSAGAFDGIHVVADGAGTVAAFDLIDVQIDNTMAGGGNQQNALDFAVSNSAQFNFSIANSGIFLSTPSSMTNSDADGVFGRAHSSGIANVTIDGTPIDNSGTGAGHDGVDLLADTAGNLNFTLQNGASVNDSARNGFLASATDAGSMLNILVDGSTVDDNGFPGLFGNGMDLTASAGAALTATVQNGSSVDDNGLNGVIMAAHGAGTTADLTVDDSTVDGNGVDGIDLTADTSATLTAEVLNGSSVSDNAVNGIQAVASNVGTTLDLTVEGSNVDDNVAGAGILMNVTDDAELNADLAGSASGNADDGVNLLVDGTLGTPVGNVTIADLLADDNGDDGFDFTVQQGGELNVDFTGGASGSGNQDNGFILTATDAGTIARLDMNGANAFDNNVNGFGALVDASGIAELQAVVSGSANGNALDGVQINVLNIADVDQVGVRGPGSISNNGGNGVTIDIDNSTVDEVLVDASVGALDISNNVGDGTFINIHNGSFVTDLNVFAASMTNNGGRGLAIIGDVSQLDNVDVNGAAIANSQGGDGILFQMSNMTADILSASFNNGGSAGNAGNGINIDLDGTPVQVLNINGNSVGGVGGLVGLQFLIQGPTNPGFGGGGNPTGVFAITNTSPGLDVTGFLFDITNSNAGPAPVFDTLDSQLGFKFLPFGGSDTTTGLATINGTPVVPPIVDVAGTDTSMDSIGTILLGGGIPNNTSIMDLTFADFNPGETFRWDIDVDPQPNTDAGINGNQLAGADITVNFAGGLFIAGSLVQISPNASNFVATSGNISSPGISENQLDGILINARNGSDIGALSIDANTIDNNGQSGAGNGVNFQIADSTLPGPGAPATLTGNTITNHAAGDGVHLVLPDTDGTAVGMDFTANTITDNTGGMGVNIQLDPNAAQAGTANTFNFDGNDISRNGSFGVGVDVSDSVEYELNAGQTSLVDYLAKLTAAGLPTAGITVVPQNILDGNADAGIALIATDNTIGRMAIANTAVTNTINGANPNFDGDGLRVILSDSAELDMPLIGGTDPMTPNTEFSGNAGRGISLELNQASVLLNPTTIQNSLINNNGSHGIEILRFADSFLDDVLITNNQINGNGGDGINLTWQGGNIDTVNGGTLIIDADIVDNQINMNDGNGVFISLDADVISVIDISGNTIDNSGDAGIAARLRFDSVMDGIWDGNVITNSGRLSNSDGINVTLTERTLVGTGSGFAISDSRISGSDRDGINFTLSDATTIDFVIETSEVSMSGRDGIRINTGNSPPAMLLPLAQGLIQDNAPQFPGDTRGIHNNSGIGINLLADGESIIDVTANNNLIASNGLDGIHADAAGTSDIFLDAADNVIEFNLRHGVNLETSGSSVDPDLSVTLTDNSISRNAQRGVSLINRAHGDTVLNIVGTVDPIPSQGAGATSRIEQNGEIGIFVENNAGIIGTENDISLTIFQTAIVGNGANVGATAFDRNGVVLRVGTSSSGEFTSNVDRNFFSGNGNIDFVIESFAATPVPGLGVADPLARFGIRLANNVGDSIDVTRGPVPSYNNADPDKSPLALYSSNSRARIATRATQSFGPRGDGVVQAAPAPTTTTFTGGGIAESAFPQNTLVDLDVNVMGVGTSTVTAYAAGTDAYTVAPAFGAAPVAGQAITVQGNNTIAGAGGSTFISSFATIAAGGNSFGTIISDFDDTIGAPNIFFIDGNEFRHDFMWAIQGGAPPFIFP